MTSVFASFMIKPASNVVDCANVEGTTVTAIADRR
jgi:hypothetical protein